MVGGGAWQVSERGEPVTKRLFCFQCWVLNAPHKTNHLSFQPLHLLFKIYWQNWGIRLSFCCCWDIFDKILIIWVVPFFGGQPLLILDGVNWSCPIPASDAVSLPMTTVDDPHCECINTYSGLKYVADKVQHGCRIRGWGDRLCFKLPWDPPFLLHIA